MKFKVGDIVRNKLLGYYGVVEEVLDDLGYVIKWDLTVRKSKRKTYVISAMKESEIISQDEKPEWEIAEERRKMGG